MTKWIWLWVLKRKLRHPWMKYPNNGATLRTINPYPKSNRRLTWTRTRLVIQQPTKKLTHFIGLSYPFSSLTVSMSSQSLVLLSNLSRIDGKLICAQAHKASLINYLNGQFYLYRQLRSLLQHWSSFNYNLTHLTFTRKAFYAPTSASTRVSRALLTQFSNIKNL